MRNTARVSTGAPFSLTRFLADVRWVAPARGETLHVDRLPDGRTALILRVLDDGRGDVCVAGPRTRAQFKDATRVTRALTLEVKPGWAASLLGVAASAVRDHIVPLEDLWGRAGADLSAELLAARSVPAVLAPLSRAIAARMQDAVEPASAHLARRAVRLIEGGEARVERVAQHLGITARHLRRAFAESVGITPKELVRALRLQRAVRGAATSRDWSRIATDAGYYDQAHLIGDFRDLLGFTPGALVGVLAQRRSPITSIAS
jgi:AraC-like DNA-binding protein